MRAMRAPTYLTLAFMLVAMGTFLGGAGAAPRPADDDFPADYRATMRMMGGTVFDERFGLTTVYVNDLAAAVVPFSQAHYPDGAVILMEFAQPQRDGEGELLRDARGAPMRGEILHVDVMRRVAGFGEAYGENRAGEWEFSSYRPDGSTLIAPASGAHCAACHRNAGADRDFVFRKRSWEPPH
jgi:cytochrome P460